jgi:RimJ/RimL family protein N-acetyltransferase
MGPRSMGHNQIEKNKKCNLFIDGKRIYLRKIKISDVSKKYLDWMRDPNVNQFLESRFDTWSIQKLRNYVRKINRNRDCLFWAIISRDLNEHIGNIKLGPINWIHKYSDLGIIIGEKSYWGKGLATETIKLVVDYSFNKLRLHKLTAGTYKNNIGSIKAFRKTGFLVEGIRKKQYFYRGKYVDGILLGLIRK